MQPHVLAWCLERIPAGEVWGVGRQTQAKFFTTGITTTAGSLDMPR
ncbi:hypothetical protein [Brucella sp. LJL56]